MGCGTSLPDLFVSIWQRERWLDTSRAANKKSEAPSWVRAAFEFSSWLLYRRVLHGLCAVADPDLELEGRVGAFLPSMIFFFSTQNKGGLSEEQHTMKYRTRKYQSKRYFQRIHLSPITPLSHAQVLPGKKKKSKDRDVLLSLFIVSAYCWLTIKKFYQVLAKN